MSVRGPLTDIIGVRILQQNKDAKDGYHVLHVFEGDGWKDGARLVLPMYQSRSNIVFHTLHQWKTGVHVPIEVNDPTAPFWLYNPYFHAAFLAD